MPKSKKVKIVSIDKINNPWGGDEKIKQEVIEALERLSENPKPLICKRCGSLFQPAPMEWIYYKLCNDCFKLFDDQKMMGRRAIVEKKNRFVKHFEDVDEWIKQLEN